MSVSIQKKVLKHILAFRRPRHRLDVQRMPGEQGRHESAAPQGTRQPVQPQEEQEGVDDVENQIGRVMAAGIQTIQLAIQHV